ncbi:TRAP transporter substrate-binding protein DctP [Glutamicibacter arilaitensis]|uniref:TRAP transporter substrate-binding protein DctP n=1 Tax=Glutamicibacter arilaitensis TaxID=256701 RepID=UPI00385079F3
MFSRKYFAGALSMLAVAALGLTSCAGGLNSSGGNAGSAGGAGIDPGATKEQYIAAFEDIEPITLDFQYSSTNPKSFSAQRDLKWAESVEEWSGGKVTIESHAAGAIAKPTEVPGALQDGRLDVAHYYTTYEPQEMAAFVDMSTSLVQLPSSPVVGEFVSHAVMMEVGFNTPEVMTNYEDRGMHVLHPANPNGNTSVICREDQQAPADWAGSQIRGNAAAHEIQAKALGGVLTSVELAETYEALERGVLNCSLQSTATAVSVGWLEVAPFISIPKDASFAPGAGALVAGSSWDGLPLLVQQLMFDRMEGYVAGEDFNAIASLKIATETAEKQGGKLDYLDSESEAAIAESNKELLAQVENSKNLDGKAVNAAVASSIEKWTGIAKELGYVEKGGVTDFTQWYEGSVDPEDLEYFEPFAERVYEEIILPQRPQ